MRIVIVTGKGGVGKTSISAATAYKASQLGLKTLVMSTDQAHSLGDSFDCQLGGEAQKIAKNLYAQEIDVRAELYKHWNHIKDFIRNTFQSRGIDNILAEELSVFPGMDELFSILILKDLYINNAYDLVIMDCAPTAATIRQLSFPEVGSWYLKKIFPIQRNAVKIARPIAQSLYDVQLPGEGVFENIENIVTALTGMKEILANPEITSIRFVINLEKMVIKEAQRAFTYMNLFGYNVDGIFVNKIFPQDLEEGYFNRWKKLQKDYTETVYSSFSPVPIFKANLFDQEIVGFEMLEKLANHIFEDKNPAEIFYKDKPIEIKADNGNYILEWRMSSLNKNEIELWTKGEELILQTPQYSRNMILPRVLVGKDIYEAKYENDKLRIVFENINTES